MKNSQRNAAQATEGTPERIRVNRNNSPDAHRRPAGKLLGLPLFQWTAEPLFRGALQKMETGSDFAIGLISSPRCCSVSCSQRGDGRDTRSLTYWGSPNSRVTRGHLGQVAVHESRATSVQSAPSGDDISRVLRSIRPKRASGTTPLSCPARPGEP
jgi:hypothetical protein